jgi:DNA-directed RNA polymerase I, II, and III subunit RPABC5
MPLANKYAYYLAAIDDRNRKLGTDDKRPQYFTADMLDKPLQKTVAGEVLDSMGILMVCCRRHMLTHVEVD